MKKPILIITSGVVVISLLLLVNEKWIKEPSAPKAADKQQESAAEGQGSPTEQRTTDKPTSKPPIYDLTNKAHWYDPETTIGLYESKTLAEWLEPFKPDAREFQIIARYENEYKQLNESQTEDEYYSVEGRNWIVDEVIKLNKQLRKDLGLERTQFYAEVRERVSGYYDTWRVLTVNGISENRVAEFRDLADEFNQQMHGIPLFRAKSSVIRPLPRDDFSSGSLAEQRQIAKSFRDRIEKEFGKQVLDDVLSLRGETFFMDQLDMGDPNRSFLLSQDPKQRERLERLYDVNFGEEGDEDAERHLAEVKRLQDRERELAYKWQKHLEEQQSEPEEDSGEVP